MTTYYVRRSGSDSNAGTSAGAAWATIGKALTGGMASGDTVYIGAGIYREAVTVTVAPTATTYVIGDVDGAKTGDAGEVRWTGMATDFAGASSGIPLNANSKNFWSFSNIVFQASGSAAAWSNLGGHDISFTDCAFFVSGAGAITATVDAALNLTFDRCYFTGMNSNISLLSFTLPTSTVADYNVNVLVRNCLFLNGSNAVNVTASGANSFKGGGITVRSCTMMCLGSGAAVNITSANVSTSIPVNVYDSWITANTGAALSANTSGQIVEDYNLISNGSAARSNVTAGTHSNTIDQMGLMISIGQERIWGGQPRPFGSPVRDSLAYGWGTQGSGPTVDMLTRPRPSGANRVLFTGTATAGAATTLTDSGAAWGTNQLASAVCKLTGGTGSGQTKIIKSNTGTALTFYGNWKTNPDNTSTYAIYFGTPSDTFTCTSGSTTTAVQSSASWVTNMWAGFILEVTAGTGSGQITTITSNTGTTLTVPTLSTGLNSTSQCVIYKQTSVNACNSSAGCFERHDTAEKETTTTDAGGVSIRLTGKADHAVYIPVDASSTTISVRANYDTNHGTTNKPQAVLDANGEIGVTTETKTMTAAANTWETLTFTAQTPSAKGWVTVRLVSRSDVPIGHAFFDTVAVA